MPKGVVVGVEHGEAGMVLGREHDVADAGQMRQPSPIQWIELVRVEGFGQLLEEAVRVFRRCADQRVADDHAELAVHAPVDEEAEALIAEPLQPLRLIQRAYFRIVRGSGAGQSEEITGQEDKEPADAWYG